MFKMFSIWARYNLDDHMLSASFFTRWRSRQ